MLFYSALSARIKQFISYFRALNKYYGQTIQQPKYIAGNTPCVTASMDSGPMLTMLFEKFLSDYKQIDKEGRQNMETSLPQYFFKIDLPALDAIAIKSRQDIKTDMER